MKSTNQLDRRRNGITNKLALVAIKRNTTTHMVKFVKSVEYVDGIAIVTRFTDKGLSECFYKPEEITAIVLPPEP